MFSDSLFDVQAQAPMEYSYCTFLSKCSSSTSPLPNSLIKQLEGEDTKKVRLLPESDGRKMYVS